MSARFEVLKNGERVALAGLKGNGVLSVDVVYVPGKKWPDFRLGLGGLGNYFPDDPRQQHVAWQVPEIALGDEITIRLLPEGDFDPPYGNCATPEQVIEDPQFGRLEYRLGAWLGEMTFEHPPVQTTRLCLKAPVEGPTEAQRQFVRELGERFIEFWPTIAKSLKRCRGGKLPLEELMQRLSSKMFIDLPKNAKRANLSFRFTDEKEFDTYGLTVRNWKIVEVARMG